MYLQLRRSLCSFPTLATPSLSLGPRGQSSPRQAEGGAPGLLVGQAALDWLWSGRKEAPLKGAAKFKAEQEGSPPEDLR